MRVGINALAIDPNYLGGVNTFTFGLLDGFAEVGSGHSFQIYCHSQNLKLFEKYRSLSNFEIVCFEEGHTTFRRALRRMALESRSKSVYRLVNNWLYRREVSEMCSRSDLIYFSTVNLFPYNYSVPTFVSLHDIQQKFFPEFFDAQELLYREITYSLTTEFSSFIQASSTYMKENFVEFYPSLKSEQVFVISEGVDIETFSRKNFGSNQLEKYNLPKRFLFFPGQLWHHKNHITVLKALKLLRDRDGIKVPLVLTGAKFSASEHIFEFIRENKMDDYVLYLGKVPFSDLIALYQTATFLITAVLYESSSLPILEAAAAGIPVIASKTPPNIEMGQKIHLNLFEPKDEEELRRVLLAVWNDGDLIRSQREHNSKAIQQYSWNNIAAQYLDYFESKLPMKAYASA